MSTMTYTMSSYGAQTQWAASFSMSYSRGVPSPASVAHPSPYASNCTLFSEKEPPHGVYLLLEGEVKLSMNSIDGRRLILRIAKKGEILGGRRAALSGKPYEVTAETLYPCKLAFVSRREFLAILVRHPEGLSIAKRGAAATSPLRANSCVRLAYPLRCRKDLPGCCSTGAERPNDRAGNAPALLTYPRGDREFIGASRETVTRTLTLFKTRQLVNFHGSMMTIPSKAALENYARC